VYDRYPTFPLNTDGIDPSGKNILVENVVIENFDDAIAVKPLDGTKIHHCTEDVIFRNSKVTVRYNILCKDRERESLFFFYKKKNTCSFLLDYLLDL
jgi:hypothetical protein